MAFQIHIKGAEIPPIKAIHDIVWIRYPYTATAVFKIRTILVLMMASVVRPQFYNPQEDESEISYESPLDGQTETGQLPY